MMRVMEALGHALVQNARLGDAELGKGAGG
jgi:hypothetical protein